MQIRLYNSSNNNHIALRFAEVTSRQLVMPFMLSKPVTQLRMQIVQKIGSVETILAQEYYRHTGFRLTNVVLDGSTLKIYANGSIIRTVTVTPVTVNRLELTGGAKKLLVDEMFVAPQAATADDIETWYNLDQQFLDENEIITHEGAGANLLIDKFGIKATRKSDGKETFKLDTETGDVHFEGDGVFRGRVEANEGYFHGEVKSVDADGNYSVLDQARLRFYRRIGNEDVLSYYVAQIATGQAVDGQVVDLAALGYRFFEAPKVVLQPKLNRVFVANTTAQDVWMDWDVEDETFNPQTGAATFRVRARTIVKGGTVFGSFSPNKLTTEGSSTTTTTGPGTTYLRLRLSGYAYRSFILDNANLTFRIRYRKSGTTSWTVLDTRTYTAYMHAELPITNFSYNVPSSGDVGYDVQVTVTKLDNQGNEPRETPHLTIHEFEYRSGDTILSDPANPEIVSWIAIDGG